MSLHTVLKSPLLRKRKWWLIDGNGHRVGRLATEIVRLLLGKHKPIYNPSVDMGDYVIVTNAEKVEFSGHKWEKNIIDGIINVLVV